MIHPSYAHYDRTDDTTWLYFDDSAAYPIQGWLKGGICFPTRYRTIGGGIDNKGFALMGAMNIRTKEVTIYEQMAWVTMQDVLAGEGETLPVNALKYAGLSRWLNKVWTSLFARKYYYHQPEELVRKHIIEISRDPMIEPKPQMVEVPVSDESQYLDAVWQWVKGGKLIVEAGSELGKDLVDQMQDDKYTPPSIQALGCCLMAFERFPYRKPKERVVDERLIA
jgi:hypothetical protein